ncbi:MAG TPA: hypothetical protein VGH74_07285, partial [Planctomycetaceae bacterium]
MHDLFQLADEHLAVSRRYFLQWGGAGVAALQLAPLLALPENARADDPAEKATLATELAKLEYL